MRLSVLVALAAIAVAGPAQADCLAEFKSVLSKAFVGAPYAMELTFDGIEMTAEVVPPSASHATMVTGDETLEMTTLDGKAWMKEGGTWRRMPDELATQIMEGVPGMIDEIANAECLGTQVFEGNDYVVFEVGNTVGDAQTSNTFYVDPATSLPSIILETTIVGGKTKTTRATYRYDPDVKITAPE